ncbi:metal ABC transporter substrate-binding protein [Herbaspirillum lusitanum]|uniref:metal ABC transporter substrate-binding protein n=1 Tax=Herbaspirillum lusitanum TaxID=213312 RepID=UPI002236F15F|nr:metal ABC transporter substrate-binding protein [Herbaspirillum lusitanum]MCW5298287.1 metal ABC transporter substrate-binding protein [Herbaspirillum lusitanum]
MKLFRQVFFSIAAMLAVQGASAGDARLPVVASFSILGDIVANIGGDRITVTTLVGPDQDAHVFQPAPDHIKSVARARLVVVNGLGFEGWMDRVTQSANYRGDIVVASKGIAVRDRVEEEHDHDDHDDHDGHEHHHGKNDPHAWQNPANVVIYTQNIVAALSKLDPSGAALYRKNGDAYIAALTELDRWAMRQFAQFPPAKRKVITSHDAFEYFGAHYEVRFLAPQGVSTDSEPSAKEVANLIRQIRKEKIRAVFIENMSSPKLLQQIGKEAGVTLGGKLYADALSQADGPAPTYLKLMRYNIEQLLAQMKLN